MLIYNILSQIKSGIYAGTDFLKIEKGVLAIYEIK